MKKKQLDDELTAEIEKALADFLKDDSSELMEVMVDPMALTR